MIIEHNYWMCFSWAPTAPDYNSPYLILSVKSLVFYEVTIVLCSQCRLSRFRDHGVGDKNVNTVRLESERDNLTAAAT